MLLVFLKKKTGRTWKNLFYETYISYIHRLLTIFLTEISNLGHVPLKLQYLFWEDDKLLLLSLQGSPQ